MQHHEQILIVDDDPTTRAILSQHLTDAGHRVIEATSGRSALLRFAEERPSIIISDWVMPGMDGIELCRHIREAEGQTPIYFIMLTQQSEKERVTEAFEMGVDDFLRKPFHHGEICARVRAGLRILNFFERLQKQNVTLQRTNGQLHHANVKLQKAATTDELTRLPNRREAMEGMKEYWRRSSETQEPLTCGVVDIDHFKRINDTFGHLQGDEVLQRTAQALSGALRDSDRIYRLGGEEFLILFPGLGIDDAVACADRCCQTVFTSVFADAAGDWPISISLGVAPRTTEMTSWKDLLREADGAMYRAKGAGRNRVAIPKVRSQGEFRPPAMETLAVATANHTSHCLEDMPSGSLERRTHGRRPEADRTDSRD